MMKIPFVSFEMMHKEIEEEILAKFKEVYEKNWFIQGPEVEAFEHEFAEYCGTKYCVGCRNFYIRWMLYCNMEISWLFIRNRVCGGITVSPSP